MNQSFSDSINVQIYQQINQSKFMQITKGNNKQMDDFRTIKGNNKQMEEFFKVQRNKKGTTKETQNENHKKKSMTTPHPLAQKRFKTTCRVKYFKVITKSVLLTT